MWMLLASLLFSGLGALVKLLHELPVWEVVFFRSLINFLLLLPWLLRHGASQWRKDSAFPLILRSVSGCMAMGSYFYALEKLKLADAVILNYSSPIPTLLLSALVLGESLSLITFAFILIGFLGIGFILKPDMQVASTAGLIGFSSAFFSAIAYVSMKVATRKLSSKFIVVTFAGIAALISFFPMMLNFKTPSFTQWIMIAIMGTVASLAQLSMTRAYKGLQASLASTLSLSTVVFSAVLGFFIWNEVPDRYSVIGTLLVLFGLMGAYRFRKSI